jgi:hypothetical protein
VSEIALISPTEYFPVDLPGKHGSRSAHSRHDAYEGENF